MRSGENALRNGRPLPPLSLRRPQGRQDRFPLAQWRAHPLAGRRGLNSVCVVKKSGSDPDLGCIINMPVSQGFCPTSQGPCAAVATMNPRWKRSGAGAKARGLLSPRSHRNPMTLVMVSAASPLTDPPSQGRAAESRQGFATNRGLHIEAGKPLPDHDMKTQAPTG